MSERVTVGAHPWVFAAKQPKYDIFPIIGDVFSDIAYAGFDGIELMHIPLLHDDAVGVIEDLSAEHELPVIGSSFGGAMWDSAKEMEVLSQAATVAEALDELGGRTLGISTGAAPERKTPQQLDQQAGVLKDIAAICRAHGLQMNLHNHTYEVQDGEYELSETLKRFADVKLGPDLDWLTRAGVDPADFLKRHGERVVFLHLRDSLDGHWVEGVGDGSMDFSAIRDLVEQVGSVEHAVVELAWEAGFEPTRPLRETLKLSREHIRETMGW